jgi:membrane protein YdbS with pleckstrin-like domain
MRTVLKKEERILLITRQHWIRLVLPIVVWIIAAVLLIWLMDRTGFIITLVVAIYPLYEYLSYRSNLWCVTNMRVVDETGFLSRHSKESPLDKINNVSYDQTVMGRLFNFGHVEIQTAAQVGATDYYNVNHPKRLKDTITAAQADFQRWQFGNQAEQLAASMEWHAGGGAAPRAETPQIAVELEKLFELKMKGALSEEEYNRAKNRLLGH